MARTERFMRASPSTIFRVLGDPRSYVYWVIGSREIRQADRSWPQPGSRFAHTFNIGPLRVQDQTRVEEVEPDRWLQIKAKARPFGTARIKIRLDPADGGTRVTMIEDAADSVTAFLFQPLTHLLVRHRNERSLDRLEELALGRVTMPGDEPEAPARWPGQPGPVINPTLHGRAAARRRTVGAVGRGALAGVAGAAAMSVSTNAEMRLRGRPPSDAPGRAIERLLGVRIRGRRGRMIAGAAGHTLTSVGVGAARGALDAAGLPAAAAGAATFTLALLPEIAVVPALGAAPPPSRWDTSDWAISVLHHTVFAATVMATYAALRRATR